MRFLLVLFILGFPGLQLGAQEKTNPPPTPVLTAEQKKREALNGILARQETLRETIEAQRKITQDENLTDFERSEAAKEIAALQLKIQELEKEFSNLATSVDLEDLGAPQEEINLDQELKEVLRPLIEEFREITAAPRETEELRSEINVLKARLELINQASNALRESLDPANPKTLNEALQKKLEGLEQRKKNLETELGIAEAKLAEREENTPDLLTSLSQMVQDFFRSRGAHILIAILAALVTFFLIRFAYRSLTKITPKKVGRAENLTGRFLNLSFLLASVLGALTAFIITLYLANDWLLLAITLLFLLGIAWAGKKHPPQILRPGKNDPQPWYRQIQRAPHLPGGSLGGPKDQSLHHSQKSCSRRRPDSPSHAGSDAVALATQW